MLEIISWSFGIVGASATVFIVGMKVGGRKNGYVKTKDCLHTQEVITSKQEAIHEKINTVALNVAEIKGILTTRKRDK